MDGLREQLALGCRILAMEGQEDLIWGHMSARAEPGGDRYWLKGAGLGLSEVTPQDFALLDYDGNVQGGEGKRHSEHPIHGEILRRRPDVMAVIHTHPPYATILGSSGHPFRPVTAYGTLLWPPEVPRYGLTTNLIRTRERGEELVAALGDHKALFLKNHGVVLACASVEEAVLTAIFLERASRDQLTALSAGGMSSAPAEDALDRQSTVYHAEALRVAWDYLCRQVPRW